ncbi:MAG: NADH-quinone oxidoreductase subunit C [Candidatus Neomarinimicrobiota bacterium]|nr:MAG: NADH-quinone oxidoreductase subunit C [Candidatus Neomarinimicrobiota bacterium]
MNAAVTEQIRERFPQALAEGKGDLFGETAGEDFVALAPEPWLDVARWLRDDPALKLDSLQCITGVDLGPEQPLEVRYNLHSMLHHHHAEIRIVVPREDPVVPSVAEVWKIADWFEREVYDLFGVTFTGHPNLKRILLPEDWEGYPLRKDYTEPETYHGIVVPKVKTGWE